MFCMHGKPRVYIDKEFAEIKYIEHKIIIKYP